MTYRYGGKPFNTTTPCPCREECNNPGAPNESVPYFICSPDLADWQKYRCSDKLAGKFIIDRGFGWELLTFSSILTRAGCRNSEDLSSWLGNFLCLAGKKEQIMLSQQH